MAQQKKDTALAVMENFQIVSRYDGMNQKDKEILREQREDLGLENEIDYRKIKIPSGGGTSFEVQTEDDDTEPMKTITGVVIFTHALNGYWSNAYGNSNNPEDKLPYCVSMDGKTGFCQETGEVTDCKTCQRNKFGTARDQAGNQARGKACKNMCRLYILMDGDPNLYLLTVPPTSVQNVTKQLGRILPYTNKVVTFSLEKTVNSGGTPYSKVVIKKAGTLPPAAAAIAEELFCQVKSQYKNMAVTMDDYASAQPQGKAVAVSADDFDDGAGFQEAPPHTDADLPF